MYTCCICGKEVKDTDEFVWFGVDGDKIHKKCEVNKDKFYDKINNMTDKEFKDYLLGK